MPGAGINQSTLIVGALLAGFVIWLAVNNRFGAYYNILIGSGGTASGGTVTPDPTSPMYLGQQFREWLKQFFGGGTPAIPPSPGSLQ